MARQRRGGGFRGSGTRLPSAGELRGTLGTLLRTTLAQAGTLRDALERGAREGRSRLDDALSSRRRRTDALAELGEIVLDLIRRGEIDLGELPEVQDVVAQLDELDAGHPDEHDEEVASPPVRSRFDTRRRDDDDGTVASRSWSPPRGAAKPAPKVWRPPADEPRMVPAPEDRTARDRGRERGAVAKPKDAKRKGGIQFDDDEDLAEYMHPDDVPPKGSPDRDS